MGDNRSWGAEKEDEIVVCAYGAERRYFDVCLCDGCAEDRARMRRITKKLDDIRDIASRIFYNLPEEDWDKVVSVRIDGKE